MRFRIQATKSDHVTMRMYEGPVLDEALLDSCGCGTWDLCVVRHTKEIHFNLGQFVYDIPDLQPSISTERHKATTEGWLAERFGIGLMKARSTLNVTTQKGIKSAIMPLSRRYTTDRFYYTKRLMGKFSTDTMYVPTKTLHQSVGK